MRDSGRRTRTEAGRTEGLASVLERLAPDAVVRLAAEIDRRLGEIPNRLNRYGYDPWGFHPKTAQRFYLLQGLLYRYWFRVENFGIDRLPAGRCLVIANHAGQIPLDAAMICTAALLEAQPPRILRGMAEYWVPSLPFLSVLMHRIGAVVGTPENCRDLLENEEAVLAFPEGVRGISKPFRERYRLRQFGHGFLRLALQTRAPVVPVAVVGSEEHTIALANLEGLARRLGIPAFPITLTWPWLGPLGLVPLPVKYRIYWGEPLQFEGDPSDPDEEIAREVERVRGTIQRMLDRALARRRSWFR